MRRWKEHRFWKRRKKRILTFLCKELGLCAAVILVFCVRCIWHITVFSEMIDKVLSVTVIFVAVWLMTAEFWAFAEQMAEK